MRVGINPEKFKDEKNLAKKHRVLVVFYIPNVTEEYYLESIPILDKCLSSLSETVNFDTTAITLINNFSCKETESVVQKYISKNVIDKYVVYNENRGKVYAVLSEARASYEPLITISDADILFFSGWEKAVISIFKSFPKAGVVSPLPLPNLVFNHNYSVFFDNYVLGKIKYGKVASDTDLELYLQGLGNDSMLNRNNRKYNFKQKHYYLKSRNGAIALLGAGHFVSTYKKSIFDDCEDFPDLKFKNGFEDIFMDRPSDTLGLYRLSTHRMFAYHIGNKMDNFVTRTNFSNEYVEDKMFSDINFKLARHRKVYYYIRVFVFKVIKKIKKL